VKKLTKVPNVELFLLFFDKILKIKHFSAFLAGWHSTGKAVWTWCSSSRGGQVDLSNRFRFNKKFWPTIR
jgi:hypothetical protein